jgi:hypothetical protein
MAGLLTAPVAALRAQPVAHHRCVSDTLRLPVPLARVERFDTIAPGITYTCLLRAEGPWLLHVATIDLRRPDLRLEAVRATDRRVGRERVSEMVARLTSRGEQPLVAINADFFDLATGEIENNHVVRGAWVKGARLTDSPHDEFDNAHTQFALDAHGSPHIGRFTLEGELRAGRVREPLAAINYRPPFTPGLVLYTPWYGPRTLRDTVPPPAALDPAAPPRAARDPDLAADSAAANRPPPSPSQRRADSARAASLAATRQAVELVLIQAGRRGDTLLYRVRDARLRRGGGTPIPTDGAVLSATGDSAIAALRAVARRGTLVRVHAALAPAVGWPQLAVGGWPRVVQGGRNVAPLADSLEGTFPRFSAARHPRSAIALSADSSQLLLVVVDGRRPWSVGMSLAELGDALLALGASEGMNLDGGGSSVLWLDGAVVNHPSDPAGERAVGNALVVRRRLPPPPARR